MPSARAELPPGARRRLFQHRVFTHCKNAVLQQADIKHGADLYRVAHSGSQLHLLGGDHARTRLCSESCHFCTRQRLADAKQPHLLMCHKQVIDPSGLAGPNMAASHVNRSRATQGSGVNSEESKTSLRHSDSDLSKLSSVGGFHVHFEHISSQLLEAKVVQLRSWQKPWTKPKGYSRSR